MRILLINSNTRDDVLAAPPIGVSYVATATERAGHDVRVADCCFASNPEKRIHEVIRSFDPEVIGISVRNIDNVNMLHPVSYLADVRNVVRAVKALSQAPIVIGGSGAGLCPKEVLLELDADYVVTADGEHTFVRLLEAIQTGGSPDGLPGLTYRDNGRVRLSPPEYRPFVGGNPMLGRWVNLEPYIKNGASYTVQTKRGCTQRCIYCSYNQVLEGNRLRLRPPVEVVDEIEEVLHTHGPECIEFVDSVFNQPYGHCVEILEEIVRRPWTAKFTAMGISPRNCDDELLKLMDMAGFGSFMITPESASPRMIESYGKGFTHDDLIQAAEAINRSTFTAMYYFLIGGPGEDRSTVKETIDFIDRYVTGNKRPPYTMANIYLGIRVYPRTALWDIAVNEGLFSADADPLQQLWYISESLDLEHTVKDLTDAARRAPEVCLGFDERYLIVSKLFSLIGHLFNAPKPYWRHYWGVNNVLMRTGLRSLLQPRDVPGLLRERLKRQGYSGPLLNNKTG